MIEDHQFDLVESPNSGWKKWPILLAMSVSFLVLLVFVWKNDLLKKFKSDHNNFENGGLTQKIEVPDDNFVIFTRCFNGKRQPQYCNLYTSSLSQYEERKIYTFDFPHVEDSDYEMGYQLKIVGVVDRTVIYKKIYWEKKEGRAEDIQVIGVLDLKSLENKELHVIHSLENDPTNLVNYTEHLDTFNKKIYFLATNIAEGQNKVNKILVYDLVTKVETIIADTDVLNDRYTILGSSKTKLFLAKDVVVGSNNVWNRTFDLEKGALDDNEPNLLNPVFDSPGERLLYLQTNKISETTENVCLMYKMINESETQEVYCLRNNKIPQITDSVQNYRHFSDYSLIGDWVSYSISTEKVLGEKDAERYEVRLGSPDPNVLEMYKNGKVGKDYYEMHVNSFKPEKVVVPNKPYRWTECTEHADIALLKQIGQCILYKKSLGEGSDTWYLGGSPIRLGDRGASEYANHPEKIGESGRVIVIEGENVFVVAK